MNFNLWNRSKRLKEIYWSEFGEKRVLSRSEYKIYFTLLTGCVPNDLAVKIIFNDKDNLAINEADEIIFKKAHIGTDYGILAMHEAFDDDRKGYFDTKDLFRVWKNCNSSLSWDVIRDCFLTLAPQESLDYDTFKTSFMLYLVEPERKPSSF